MRISNGWHWGLLAIILMAIATRWWNLGGLPYTVADEVYSATVAAQYIDGKPFLDGHPPVARLHFAALAYIGGANPSDRFERPGMPYDDFPFKLLRAGSATAGVLLVLFIALVTREVTGSKLVGVLAGFMAVFDNALIFHSRLILPDMWLLMYGMGGLWCFLKKEKTEYLSRAWYSWLLLAVILFGLSAGSKVTGFLFPAVAFFYSLVRPPTEDKNYAMKMFKYLLVAPWLIGSLFFLIHWLLLDATGPIYNSITNTPAEIFSSVSANNLLMKTIIAQLHAVGGHFIAVDHGLTASRWWMWPVMQKPVLMAAVPFENMIRIVAFVGNPVVWWGGLIAFIWLLKKRLAVGLKNVNYDLFIFGYVFYLFIMMLIPRQMFMYHYLPALVFLIPMLAIVLAQIYRRKPRLVYAWLLIVVAGYVYVSPYTYGRLMTQTQIDNRAVILRWNPLSVI